MSTRLKTSEDEKKALHIDLVKSKAHIVKLEEEKKFLHDNVSFLEREYKGLLESKKSLKFKLIKLDGDLHKLQELSKRLFQRVEKLDKMSVIRKSVDDKGGLGYINTLTISKTVFVKGNPNQSPPQVKHKSQKE